jgi:tRNA 2-selenouridine synthase
VNKQPSRILFNDLPILDVRSPGEFQRGAVPGALSFPLFSNEERAMVGTCYKKQGKQAAVELGMKFTEPKLNEFVQKAKELLPSKSANMYCWRGGMRSQSMAWLLRSAGFEINVIDGGYKAWRTEVMERLSHPYRLINIGGLTGVGKTDILVALSMLGEQIVNLEHLASHTGSAFNPYPHQQPSTEQFENLLAVRLMGLNDQDCIWVEDESKSIGKVFIHHDFFTQKQAAPFVLISRPKEERVRMLCALYGQVSTEVLKTSFRKIERKIGGQYLQAAFNYIDEGNLPSAARIALRYYDKAYMHSMQKQGRNPIHSLSLSGKTADEAAKALISWRKNKLCD